ncbi:LD-carboxypeptidase [Sphaerisporangium sp. TRM90804]|uniref:S66 peptidase family protein n=1 Tax=Sphaerisporangium sp. TRM90804 TaxID=3031113 RepID=UPI00244728B5|nr:LD-carboxypeptidase [Sphaerisporangium sp. TRM90804]MDH2430207.1 LD-carboxypeptidase [Sphaerisporangium sp. TRM90804]
MTARLWIPGRLRPGDRVAVVAPSGPVDPVRLAHGRHVLAQIGLRVEVMPRVLNRRGYLAGSDAGRAADIQEAWCDPEIRAVICARGGYGATRILELFDWPAMAAARPKILLGSSDVTALHQAFAVRLGVASCFGPMPACQTLGDPEGPDADSLSHLYSSLFEGEEPGAVAGDRVIVPGYAEGPLTGGNLSLLASLCGTPYSLRSEGHIVLLEDVGEEPYRVDRMLTQLLQAGCLDGAIGFVLGSWERCGDPIPVLMDRLAPLGVPIIAGLPIGHGVPQFTAWMGADAVIDTESCSLTCLFRDPATAL